MQERHAFKANYFISVLNTTEPYSCIKLIVLTILIICQKSAHKFSRSIIHRRKQSKFIILQPELENKICHFKSWYWQHNTKSVNRRKKIITICVCTTIHRYPIFSTRYSVMCMVYIGYCGTSEIEHGLCACTVDNPLVKARGLSLRTDAQTMLYLSLVKVCIALTADRVFFHFLGITYKTKDFIFNTWALKLRCIFLKVAPLRSSVKSCYNLLFIWDCLSDFMPFFQIQILWTCFDVMLYFQIWGLCST